MRPLIVLGGTFASQRVANRYYASLYPTEVLALPGGGRDRLRTTYATIREAVANRSETYDEPVVLAGHSQGAIHAVMFAIDNPHLVKSVVGIAGPFGGANSPLIPYNLEGSVHKIIPVGMDFRQGSEYLSELKERAKTSEVPTALVAAASDVLVTKQSAHAIDPATKFVFSGGHTTVLLQRSTKRLLKELRIN